MKNKFRITLVIALLLFAVLGIQACKKEKEAEGTDKELFEMSKSSNGFVWYKNSSDLLNKSAGSAHPQAFLRTRYNSIAASQLDTNGKVKPDAIFPEGSLVVKELHENSSTLGRYAILYKNSSKPEADTKGWVWGYINADGSVSESSSKKGSSCISCHSQTDNIDYMLMNKYFP